MKPTKKVKEKNKKLNGKDAIGTPKEKALKDVFIEESTKVRLKINIIEQSIKDLQDTVSRIRGRLGI